MRKSIRQKAKRGISLILAVMALTSIDLPINYNGLIESLAYSSSGLGTATGPSQPGPGAGGMHAVFLASIEETLDNNYGERPEFQDATGNPIPKVDAQIIETFRNKWDSTIINPENLACAAYYFKEGFGSNSWGANMCLYIDTCSGDPQLQMVSPYGGFQYMGNWPPTKELSPMVDNVKAYYKDNYAEDYQTWAQTIEFIKENDAEYPWPVNDYESATKWTDLMLYMDRNPVSGANYPGLSGNRAKVPYNVQVLLQYIVCAYGLDEGAHIPSVPANHSRYSIWTTEQPCDNADALMEAIYLAANIRLAEYQQQVDLEGQRELLKKYLMNMNIPGSGEFIVLVDVAFAGQNDNGVPMMYSYLAASNFCPGGLNISSINQMGEERYSGYEGFSDDRAASAVQLEKDDHDWQVSHGASVFGAYKWAFHYLNSWDIGHYHGVDKGLLKYTYGATKTYFNTAYGWESTIRNVDAKGRLWGMPGFGVFAARSSLKTEMPPCHPFDPYPNSLCPPKKPDNDPGGDPEGDPDCPTCVTIEPDPHFTITVETDPHSKKVTLSEQQKCVDNEQITMNINLSYTDIGFLQTELAEVVETGGSATLTVMLEASNEENGDILEPGDSDFFNQEGIIPTDFVTKVKLSNSSVLLRTKEVTTLTDLTTLLNNVSALSYIDNQIKVCENVINKYKALAYLCLKSDKKHYDYYFTPKGKEVEEWWAYDESRLYGSIDPFYYSEMRHEPLSEIKANNPKNETYEAMAGVPTTTNLYLGVGATEYMVNVDLEYKKEKGTRVYTITVNNTNCYGSNKSCVFGCGGHEDGSSCSPDSCGGGGCTGTHYANEYHPGTCSYTYKIEQPIDEYAFMDITNAQLWLLDRFKYNGNKKLTNPSSYVFDPELGFSGFYEVDSDGDKLNPADWVSGSGRLQFNKEISGSGNSQYWGNTTKTVLNSIGDEHSSCKEKAQETIDNIVSQLTGTKCSVYSDYIIAETSEGYQNVMFYKQDSQEEDLSSYTYEMPSHSDPESSGFYNKVTDVVKKSEGLHFDSVLTKEELWDNNSNCASDWESDHPTTTGYNGKYSKPYKKYDNNNSTSTSTILCQSAETYNQPNSVFEHQEGEFEEDYNSRYIKTGFNIIDSTTPPPEREWSNTDSVSPVTNGNWDTRHMKVIYKKVIEFNGTKGGKNFAKWQNWQEAPYSTHHDKINDIVIHNPISNRDATIISNNSKYDKRIYESLDSIGTNTPVKAECPGNEMCQYATLTCTETPKLHTAGVCYVDTTDGSYDCGFKPLNTHVHGKDGCTAKFKWEWVGCSNHSGTVTTDTNVEPDYKGASGLCSTSGAHWEAIGLDTSAGWGDIQTVKSGSFSYIATGTDYYTFTASKDGKVRFYSVSYDNDPQGRLYINDSLIIDNDDGGTDYNFDTGWYSYKKGDVIRLNVHQYGSSGSGTCNVVVQIREIKEACNNKPNSHVHTSACKLKVNRILKCSNPHHHFAGESWDYNVQSNHYAFADMRCYSPCNDNSKHSHATEIKLPDGSEQQQAGNMFINIDREFKIYYPDTGDFEQQPNLLGISKLTDIKGKGFIDNCDTDTWLRNKFVRYQWNCLDEVNNLWLSGEYIDLLKLPGHITSGTNPDPKKVYRFDCVLGNNESAGSEVLFLSIANNAPEQYNFDESTDHTNFKRYSNNKAKHTVSKRQYVDVIGYIGALTLHDVGDPRFAELFKKVETNTNRAGWLIDNVVKKVDYTKSNYTVADNIDVRYRDLKGLTSDSYWHSVYGVVDRDTGGKNHQHKELPLRPKDNPIQELKTEFMRPGYLSYFDIETVGNYYGENTYSDPSTTILQHLNRNSDGSQVSYRYMMQIKPKYYELNLDTGIWRKVDVYEYGSYTYKPVCLWKGLKNNPISYDSDYYLYFDWLNEQDRRNVTPKEISNSLKVQEYNTINYPGGDSLEGEITDAMKYVPILPITQKDPIGIKNALYLIDFDRTFIGSTKRYGQEMNLGNSIKGNSAGSRIDEQRYYEQAQRWHFTLGVPSSSVFVYENEIPTDAKIKEMKSHNAVIACAIEIKVRGEVWTLQYDGSLINRVDGTGIKITPDNPPYPPPTRDNTVPSGDPTPTPLPNGNTPPEDPVVLIYENDKTSADDIQTMGTH